MDKKTIIISALIILSCVLIEFSMSDTLTVSVIKSLEVSDTQNEDTGGSSGAYVSDTTETVEPKIRSAGGPAIMGLKTYVGSGEPATPGTIGGLGKLATPNTGGVDFGDINAKLLAKHDSEMSVYPNDTGLRNFVLSRGISTRPKPWDYNISLRGTRMSIAFPSIASMGGVALSSFEIFRDIRTGYANLASETARRTGMKIDILKKVPLSDEKILDSPILVFDDIRAFTLKFAERKMLTRYLDGNGLILINTRHYDTGERGFYYHIIYELRKIMREKFELKEIPKTDIIYNTFYDLSGDKTPIPSRWAQNPITGIYLNDRLAVIICRNSYTSSMADENIHHPTPSGRELAYQLHVNILVYAQLKKMGKI